MNNAEKYSPEFANSVKITLEKEGVLSDHQNDRGGLTKYGITQGFLHSVSPNEKVTDLTKERATEIYYEYFWLKSNCHRIAPGVALFIFDYSVHSGTIKAGKDLQRVLNYEPNIDLLVDGLIGDKTIKSLNEVIKKPSGYAAVVQGLATLRGGLFVNILEKRADQEVFFRGWFRRLWEITEIAQSLNK